MTVAVTALTLRCDARETGRAGARCWTTFASGRASAHNDRRILRSQAKTAGWTRIPKRDGMPGGDLCPDHS